MPQVSHRLICHQPELLNTLRKNYSSQDWGTGRYLKVTDRFHGMTAALPHSPQKKKLIKKKHQTLAER